MSPGVIEFPHGDHVISTDRARVDLAAVHRFLVEESYWASDRRFDLHVRAIEHSALVVGAYGPTGEQAGFARMVTDLATFAWLADVYVLATVRGRGLGRAMVETIIDHPAIADVRWQLLTTLDAHGLYEGFGFRRLDDPSRWMHRGASTP